MTCPLKGQIKFTSLRQSMSFKTTGSKEALKNHFWAAFSCLDDYL
jgi:hypothetical protein